MLEINIEKKLKDKQRYALINFLCDLSTEVCFTAIHYYHIDEDLGVDIVNEYKQKCKEKHHDLSYWYERQDPYLLKTLKKLRIKSEQDFKDYQDNLYQNDMMLCKKMEEIIDKLVADDTIIDYKEVFKDIASSYKYHEVHMFDSVINSIVPLDCVVYNCDERIKFSLLNMKSISEPMLTNEQYHTFLTNPTFCNDDEAFAVISTDYKRVTMLLKEQDYEKFKKLKIRHHKEESKDEKQ